jgi:transcriptional regulator with XRE-family HTH domain
MKYLVGEVRYQKRMSLRRLAERARISKSYLQRIEAGEVSPSLEIMLRLAKELDVPLGQLYREE